MVGGQVGFQSKGIFDEAGSQNTRKSDLQESAGTNPPNPCPECSSKKLYRDGIRYLADGFSVQRWLCRDCGYRFSEKPLQTKQEWSINTSNSLESKRRICAKKAKNLTQATEIKTVAGEIERLPQDIKGLITKYMAYLEKEGYCAETSYISFLKRLVNLGANLLDPESVKATIGKHKVKNGTKLVFVAAYDAFTKMQKITWAPPKYIQEEHLPFIPEEQELDCLIATAFSRKMSTYLQCLKETFTDPSEALRIEWTDISGNIISINHPVKGHSPRQLEVSNKLLAMINALPRKSERVFNTSYANISRAYYYLRRRAADAQKNPRILKIELRTFRHWGATMIAYYTNGNTLTVKKLLGLKRLENVMKYIGLIQFKDDQFEVAAATTVEEAKILLAAGFDYIQEKSGIMLYRRPKRFAKYSH
jgi:integrase